MKNKLALIGTFCAFAALLFASSRVIVCAADALRLCADTILPALFPFFVLSGLLSRLGLPEALGRHIAPAAKRLFGVSGAGATALILGLTGGYPLGADYIAGLFRDGRISRQEGERLLAFCNNSGPAFIVGAVGAGVFQSPALGLRLYVIHILAALFVGLLFRGKAPAEAPPLRCVPLPFSKALAESVKQAVGSALSVCGYVVCFTVFAGLLESLGLFGRAARLLSLLTGADLLWCKALLTGSLELGSGLAALRALTLSPASVALAAGLLGLGGVSVWFQTMAVLSDSEIKGALFFTGRLISAGFSFLLAYLSMLVF